MGNFTSKHKWGVCMALVLTVLTQLVHAQSGSTGSAFVHTGGEKGIFGLHNFQNGTGTISAGIIGSERQPAIGVYSFVNPNGSWVGASDQAFVDGYVRTYNAGPFTFPIGDNNKYRPAAVSASASAAPTTAAYYGVDPGMATTSDLKGGTYGILPGGGPAFPTTSKDVNVGTVDNVEYWDIDGTTPARITLTWDAATPISAMVGTDLSKLTIVGWDGTQWVVIPSTVDAGSLVLNTSASAFTDPAGTVSVGSITTNADVVPGSFTVYTLAGICSLSVTASATNATVCVGSSLSLSATVLPAGTYTYAWTGPNGYVGTGANPTVSATAAVTQSGTYTVVVTDAAGCSGTATVDVSVTVCCDLVAAVNPTSVTSCISPNTGALTISYSGTGSYQYRLNGGALQALGVSPAVLSNLSAGSYTIVVQEVGNPTCSQTLSTTIANPDTPPVFALSNSPLCTSSTLSLSATGNYTSYHWSGPNGFNTTQQNPSIPNATTLASGVYSVSIVDAGGCTASASTTVTIANQPSLTVTAGSGLTICSGQSTSLSVGGANGAPVTWTNNLGQSGTGTTINFPGVTNLSGQPFTVTYVISAVAGPCSDGETLDLIINPAPILQVVPQNAIICALEQTQIVATATPATATINWMRTPASPTPDSGSGTGSVTVNQSLPAGNYTYSFTATAGGCTSSPVVSQLTVNN